MGIGKKVAIAAGAVFVLGMSSVWLAGAGTDEVETNAAPESMAQTEMLPIGEHSVAACRASLALMNGRDVNIVEGEAIDGGMVHVKWRSPDGKRWQARCIMVDDHHMHWAAFDAFGRGEQGRWRTEDSLRAWIEGDRLFLRLEQMGVDAKTADYDLAELS